MNSACVTPVERATETAVAYYRQAEVLARQATKAELIIWFSAFSAEDKAALARLGPAQWHKLASLRRYLLEKRGCSMHDYMLAHLTSDELRYWVDEDVPTVPTG